ncbi:MAG: orotate phosphoribosyltransferase [bacterium]|nr:orotate phosphoribosyltransferase [bacterium]
MIEKGALVEMVRSKALQTGDFTLASGKKAKFYLDCRKLTLDSAGGRMVAEAMLDYIGDNLPDAVGGMAIGADPITASILTLADVQGKSLRGFIVRKEAKAHGGKRDVEGPVESGDEVVIVEDVVTTGGSSVLAIEKARAFGLKVREVVAIVDRLAGGAEAFEKVGVGYHSLLTIRDLGIEPE